jgi:cation-transporting P-type ATPase 13A2
MYMLLDPGTILVDIMQLTYLSTPFKLLILLLAGVGFICAWLGEQKAFPWLAKMIGITHDRIWPRRRKKRKEYKLMIERMRI